MRGHFRGADGETYTAILADGPDADGLCTLNIRLRKGHHDKHEGGWMLVHVPHASFTARKP